MNPNGKRCATSDRKGDPMNKKSKSLLLLLLLALTPTLTQAQKSDRGVKISSDQVRALPANAKRYALVIGVDQYADTQITTLGGASNDAKTLANALIQYAGFPS
jgi:hypothetical protein